MTLLNSLVDIAVKTFPYWSVLFGAMALSLVLTPLIRTLNRSLGMVDAPGGRRINKAPVPRGGGVAVFASFAVVLSAFALVSGRSVLPMIGDGAFWRLMLLSSGICALGFIDDKFGMKPAVKLLGQLIVASLVYFWCGIGLRGAMPFIPVWLDFPLTVFWITGAINAFNLIDGLDGLASGLAVIAATGMAGSLFFVESPGQIFAYLAFIGSLLGFLRYNFNPASVFLGDTGSMFLGFFLSVMPLATQTGGSFLVGIGVPLLAMGVPIFDTALAIVRRTVRAVLKNKEGGGKDGSRIMQPDSDHLHHRLLRRFVSQKKTAVAMYAFAAFLVATGIGGVALEDRAAGLFVMAFVVATFIIVRDMSRVELWDAGRLANMVARGRPSVRRRRRAAFYVPLLVLSDIAILSVSWYLTLLVLKIEPSSRSFHTFLPLRVVPVFLALVCFGSYSTVWARAVLSNYVRLVVSVGCGMLIAMAGMVLLGYVEGRVAAFPAVHFGLAMLFMVAVRSLRPFVRDLFCLVHIRKIADDPEVSRMLVFGAGLRYRAFRRELVRNILNEKRIIVGLVDDDILLRGKYIGGVRIDGPHMDAKRIVEETRADSVVIACDLAPERLNVVVEAFKACGVKVSRFGFSETAL